MLTSDFFTGSRNTAVSRMRNASGHNYWNSSFMMDVAMGQIPRSTERISSCNINTDHSSQVRRRPVVFMLSYMHIEQAVNKPV